MTTLFNVSPLKKLTSASLSVSDGFFLIPIISKLAVMTISKNVDFDKDRSIQEYLPAVL